jgi:glutaminyl-peptide cyclotransferase
MVAVMGTRIRRLMVIVVAGLALVASSCSNGADDPADGAIADPATTPAFGTEAPPPTASPTPTLATGQDDTPDPAVTPTPLATPTTDGTDPAPSADGSGGGETTPPEPDDPATTDPGTGGPTPTPTARPTATPTPVDDATPDRPVAANLVVDVLERLDHDPTAFTQGLEFHEGRLYESRGLYGRSALTEIDPATGAVLRRTDLTDEFFAEGITVVDDRIIQITWREERAFVYDIDTFAVVDEFTYLGEGWGICLDEAGADRRLVMSNGTDVLTFRDPETFAPTGSVDVTVNGAPLENINELECVDGLVWANLWLTDSIVVIDPADGTVVSVIDARGLLTPAELAGADVLNGIARDHDTGRWLITGKLWPTMFVVDFVPA